MRNKAWRRWRNELKLKKVLRHYRRIYVNPFASANSRCHYTINYKKRNSISETITVQVLCKSHYDDYVWHRARMSRDNPTYCSCIFCGNPRRSGFNSQYVLTLKERSIINTMSDDMDNEDIKICNFSWKAKK